MKHLFMGIFNFEVHDFLFHDILNVVLQNLKWE
jgi:hypothetical protein